MRNYHPSIVAWNRKVYKLMDDPDTIVGVDLDPFTGQLFPYSYLPLWRLDAAMERVYGGVTTK